MIINQLPGSVNGTSISQQALNKISIVNQI
jgi:hypothetical protein